MMPPGHYVVTGTTRRALNVGVIQNATEGGTWVFWHWTCNATVHQLQPGDTVHPSLELAEQEANRRWTAR